MPRFYTVREANEMLAELSRLLRIMQREEAQLNMLRGRNKTLTQNTNGNGYHSPAEDSALADAIKHSEEAMQTAIRVLNEWAIELKDLQRGLVDFPAHYGGRVVLLCWQLGEPEVGYWHETEAGFARRQPLTPDFD